MIKGFLNITNYFFGKDGKQYKLSEKDLKWIRKNDYEKFGIHIPSLVCVKLKHIDLLKLCIKENIPYIIFEDDTEIIKSIDFKFEDIVKRFRCILVDLLKNLQF